MTDYHKMQTFSFTDLYKRFKKGKDMTADEKRDVIAQEYIHRLEYLYSQSTKGKKPLLNLATQICAELRRAKASFVTAVEQRALVEKGAQMDDPNYHDDQDMCEIDEE